MRAIRWLIPAVTIVSIISLFNAAGAGTERVYFGTYTGQKSKGIYVSQFDPGSGKLTTPELAAECKSPSFLALHPNSRWLYAVNETDSFDGKKTGAVTAFSIDAQTGRLQMINQQSSGGSGPCHLALDRSGECVLVANYGSGSVAAFPVDSTSGKLLDARSTIQHEGSSVDHQRQEGPHAHFITPTRDDRFALACDLGLDKVLIYKLDAHKAQLAANDPAFGTIKPGSGPRHLAIHNNGRFVYVINEMKSSITAFDWDGRQGSLRERLTVSTLPADFKGHNTCAEIQMHPSGKYVCGSNRGHDSIAVFEIEPKLGRLKLVETASTKGKTPRHFTFDPSGKWLLAENQDSDSVVVLQFDPDKGHLTPTENKLEIGAPVCAVFVP